jgi:hypothetical protein
VQTRWRTVCSGSLPLEAYFDFIDPLNAFELNRPMRERITVFRALGMNTLESLFQVPKEAWLVRFGEEMDLFFEHFESGDRFPWRPHVPNLALEETTRWNADEVVMGAENLIFGLKPLVDRLCSRLYSLHLAIRKLELNIRLDRAAPDRTISLSFSFPQTSRVLLLKLLREKISREIEREPLTDPVIGAVVRVVETTKREAGGGRFAFSEKDESRELAQERWLELVAYLSLKLEPKEKIFQVDATEHFLPEKSWKKVLTFNSAEWIMCDRIAALFPKRPLRLLPEHRRISRMGPYLRHEGDLWRIQEISEPERLSGYDWDVEDSGGFDRTYYRVRVGSPEGKTAEWWIYRDERKGTLCLHGIY